MNKTYYTKQAKKYAPNITTHIYTELYRHDVTNFLSGSNNIGIELGVASGSFAKRLLDTNRFQLLFGVDVYGDTHDTQEYKHALHTIGINAPHKLLRLTFDDALCLFPNNYFDFIYIDGFAHTGEEGGKTLADWYSKLKIGGIMSGDDYHHDWPLVVWAVNHFASQLNVTINLTGRTQTGPYSKYPSWFFRKPAEIPQSMIPVNIKLATIAKKEKLRIRNIRMSPLRRFARRVLRTMQTIMTSFR